MRRHKLKFTGCDYGSTREAIQLRKQCNGPELKCNACSSFNFFDNKFCIHLN